VVLLDTQAVPFPQRERPVPLSNIPRRAFRRVVPPVAVAFAVTAGTLAAAAPARAGTAECELQYSVISPPDSGTTFTAEVTVRNIGTTPTTSWLAYIYLSPRTRIVDSWSSVESSFPLGPLVLDLFGNVRWNGSLAPGARSTFGFTAVGAERMPLASFCTVP